jgi:hypothetical protein
MGEIGSAGGTNQERFRIFSLQPLLLLVFMPFIRIFGWCLGVFHH